MAQTTRLAPFGPFFVFVNLHWPSLAAVGLRGLHSNKIKIKIKCKLKKRHTFGPFFAFVNLHGPLLAAVGLHGLRSNKKIKNKM